MKSKFFFFIPFTYFIRTRIASFLKFISWIIIYCIPTFFILYNFSLLKIGETLLIYIIQACIIYTFYEIGYIQNDCETIKKEKNPTLRLSLDEINFYNDYKMAIYSSRLVSGALLLLILNHFTRDRTGFTLFTCTSVGILLIYQIYNKIRSRFNLVLHFILVVIRFLSYPLIFLPSLTWPGLSSFCLLLFFPIINIIERASHKKFKIKFFQGVIQDASKLNTFRVEYYLMISMFTGLLTWFGALKIWYLYLALYYLSYRLLTIKIKA